MPALCGCGLIFLSFQPRALANRSEAQLEYAAGIMDYQKGRYRSAATHFKAAVEKAPDVPSHALRRLYLAHCYAALKEVDKAIPLYQEVISNGFGSAEAKYAQVCIDKLKPKEKSEKGQSYRGLINRITVLEPLAGHPPVSTEFIGMIKTTVANLPPDIYKVIDKGNCSITLAPNIVDKWPDSGNESAPGKEEVKLSQDLGRTYGTDIYMWERPLLLGGKNELGSQFPLFLSKIFFYGQIAHAVCECSHVNEDKEFMAEFKKDVEAMSPEDKEEENFYISQEKVGPSEVAAEAVANYLSRNMNERVFEHFPKCYKWVKQRFKLY